MTKFRLLVTLLVVALCTTAVFTSCNNDDDDNNGGTFEIRATSVINSNNRIATVRAEVFGYKQGNTLMVGEAPFQNNGFTLRLINEVPTSFLHPITYHEYDGFTLTISDRNARWTFIEDGLDLYAYDSNGNEIGGFGLGNERDNEWFWGTWTYVDRNVTVRGTMRDEDWEMIFDLNLRRGWNAIYWHENDNTRRTRLTTQRPSGANLQWEFFDWSRSSRSATESRKSIFRR
jgi:hypothetical protein